MEVFPLVNEVLKYSELSIEELKVPRSSEEQIKDDLDEACNLLQETNQLSRVTKYATATLKSRAMLFSGSIANYNEMITGKSFVRYSG